jgi:hypothetical protein
VWQYPRPCSESEEYLPMRQRIPHLDTLNEAVRLFVLVSFT